MSQTLLIQKDMEKDMQHHEQSGGGHPEKKFNELNVELKAAKEYFRRL